MVVFRDARSPSVNLDPAIAAIIGCESSGGSSALFNSFANWLAWPRGLQLSERGQPSTPTWRRLR
eukprot:5042245-Pyramimonas_sp.AAC.1